MKQKNDIVMLINGIPVVVGEGKTPIRPSISWLDMQVKYIIFMRIQLNNYLYQTYYLLQQKVKNYFFGSVRCPLEFWAPWRSGK